MLLSFKINLTSGSLISSLVQGMKLFRKYLEELHRDVSQLSTKVRRLEKSAHPKFPAKLIVKQETGKCEISILLSHNASTNPNESIDQELSDAQRKCRKYCEIFEALSKIVDKSKFLKLE